MRNEVIDGICQLAENDPDLYLITADLGFGVLEKFQKAFPKRFFNAGIAEQNMASIHLFYWQFSNPKMFRTSKKFNLLSRS
mgnify:CR=1 FL=1